MNKLLIVLLAVCLVSTHAFVKRDAPAPSDLQTKVAEVQKQLEDFGKSVGEQASKIFDPDNIKKNVNAMLDSAKQTLSKFNPSSEAKPASEAKPSAE